MGVKVKVFGLLVRSFPEYDRDRGMEIDLPDNATVKDLLAFLKISKAETGIVMVNGLAQEEGKKLKEGSLVYVFHAISGG